MSDNNLKKLAAFIKKNPDDSFSKFALALEFRKQGMYKKSRILFENILKNDPEYVGVYYHLGKLYETLDRVPEARKLYRQGISVADKQRELRTKSELEEALEQLQIEP